VGLPDVGLVITAGHADISNGVAASIIFAACAHGMSDHADPPFLALLQRTVATAQPFVRLDALEDRPHLRTSGPELITQALQA
jgi:hypothetical protein